MAERRGAFSEIIINFSCKLVFIIQIAKLLEKLLVDDSIKYIYTLLMIDNDEILSVKNIILNTVDCDKIYLFGSYANNTQRENSDFDLYVVLKNENENPILAEQNIYKNLSKRTGRHTPTDILAENKNKFMELCALPTIERKIAREGVLLYDIAESA